MHRKYLKLQNGYNTEAEAKKKTSLEGKYMQR